MTRRRLGPWWIAALALLSAACSSPSNDDGGMDGGSDAADVVAEDRRIDTRPPDMGMPIVLCPAAMPAMGDPCGRIGVVCTYGSDPRLECRPRAVCVNFSFEIMLPRCGSHDPAMCPMAPPMMGSACMPDRQICGYADGTRCLCTNCRGGPCGGATQWQCAPGPLDPACPRQVPNLGAACPEPGLDCNYGLCGEGSHLRCSTERIWSDVPSPCPQ